MKAEYFVACLALLATTTSTLRAGAEEKRPSFHVKGLASARNLLVGGDDSMTTSIPVYGGGLEVGFIVRSNPRSRWHVIPAIRYELGTTKRLLTHTIMGKLSAQFDSGCFNWTMGGHIAELIIERSTSGQVIEHWGIGLHTGFDFKLLQREGFELFLSPELDATFITHKVFSPRSLYAGGSLGVGGHF